MSALHTLLVACHSLDVSRLGWQPLRAPNVGRAPLAAVRAAESPLEVDVAVIGGGPAGYLMATLMAEKHAHAVALVDPAPQADWPNNYGVWRDEWEALAGRLQMPELLSECVHREWGVTDTYFGGSYGTEWGERTRLNRAYVQVGRLALKRYLARRLESSGTATVIPASLDATRISSNLFDANLVHDARGSSLSLTDGSSVRAKVVIDATGFESRLVAREADEVASLWKPLSPGYQIAYGFAVDIEGDIGPYAAEAMTLFDYRTDHFEAAAARGGAAEAAQLRDAEDRPSFMYAMPQGPVDGKPGVQRVFFEETSLVGRGARRLEFAELKKRAAVRLAHLGINVIEGSVHEEEYCYIPVRPRPLPPATSSPLSPTPQSRRWVDLCLTSRSVSSPSAAPRPPSILQPATSSAE